MKIYSDGYTIRNNPSNIGGGFVIMDENKKILSHTNIKQRYFTCNEAELLGILEATKQAKDYDEIITDSMVAYLWIKNRKCKARPDLLNKAIEANDNIRIKKIKLIRQGREKNLAGNYIEFILKY